MTRHLLLALASALLLLLVGYKLGSASSSPSRPTIPESAWVRIGTPAADPVRPGAGSARPVRPAGVPPSPMVAPTSRPAQSVSGIASWGYGWAGVVTRLHRGTPICVTGPLGRWCGRSVGYGPAVSTHRIADLSATVFRDICGPLSKGLCRVVVRW